MPALSITTATTLTTSTSASIYPIFPDFEYIERFSVVSSTESTFTDQDIDLYNYCCIPYNSLPHHQTPKSSHAKRMESWVSITIENPNYQIEE
ncbi:hypothetical protein K504DRAFT_529498 [Pleomassaria siparia CBS 279.74]|uniref:Uncharacterized protein n=1 Tax=Pleomassaria siparia CBS 279.74 TaxID=1314801 RepID=A0A6G1KQY8_9PLEO|nr:hypothetical protein K504DRAFT_529498 [Pleomassaria siparia CBS 279.74]